MAEYKPQLDPILEKIREARNLDFRSYKRATLIRRIERRMEVRHCNAWEEYSRLLDREPDEFDALVSSMLIKVTSFFRDEAVWTELSTRILPELIAKKRPDEELRIWSAGCATGEEAFSIAIQVAEALGAGYSAFNVKVFGTDVDDAAIAFARRGMYSTAQVQGVPRPLLDRWFTRDPEGYSIRKEIRRSVVFGVNNLTSDAPISRIDLILCRNVFIYMDGPLQKRVLSRFFYALRSEGILTLGRSELIPFATSVFDGVDLGLRIYRKNAAREPSRFVVGRPRALLEASVPVRDSMERPLVVAPGGDFFREAFDALDLPVIATDLDGAVVLWNRPATRLWNRAEVDVLGRSLASLALPGLSSEVVNDIMPLVRDGRIERENIEATVTGSSLATPVVINVEVSPVRDASGEITWILYVVRDFTAMRDLEGNLRRVNAELVGANEKLLRVNEQLSTTNEESESTNQELQSANEELQTTNEELQSTNEELETTNEELQSANAELDATNRELAHRTEQMHVMGLRQRTIIRSLSAEVVVIDPAGRITSWNLAAERLLGIPEGEAVGQILWTLRVPALHGANIKRIRAALDARHSIRMEDVAYSLPGAGQGYTTIAAVPLIDDQVVLGAVVLFEDTTRAMTLAQQIARSKSEASRKGRRP